MATTSKIRKIRAVGVGKALAGVTVLQDVNFELFGGQSLAILGLNGSGKTTLLRLLAGHWPVDTGSIEGAPAELVNPEERGFFEMCTVEENLIGFCGRGAKSKIVELDLKDILPKRFSQLSKAQKHLVHLSRGLLRSEGLPLLLDEPFSHLDGNYRQWLADRIRAHCTGGGSLVITAQDSGQVPPLQMRLVNLKNGRLE